MCQWYSSRNVLGSENLSPIQEWEQFAKCLLKQCGYHIDTLNVFEFSARYTGSGSSPDAASKKVRPNESGSDDDWTYLLSSSRHRETSTQISYLLGLKPVSLGAPDSSRFEIEPVSVDRTSALFSHLYSVTWSLHLLYEEIKLNKTLWDLVSMLAKLLSLLSGDLRLPQYVHHYWKDFPDVCPASSDFAKTGQVPESFLPGLNAPMGMRETSPPDIHKYLRNIVDNTVELLIPFPILRDVARMSQDLIVCYAIICRKKNAEEWKLDTYLKPMKKFYSTDPSPTKEMIDYLVMRGLDAWIISTIPAPLALPIFIAMYECRMAPPIGWKKEAYLLIGRKDFALGSDKSITSLHDDDSKADEAKTKFASHGQTYHADEMSKKDEDTEIVESEITKLRWPKDRRVSEVFRLLQSSRPIILGMQQRPEMNNHDFQVEREKCLRYHHVRRLALPVGRGAMTLQTATSLPTEPISIPNLQLKGSSVPLGHLVSFEYTDSIPNFDRWPYFHNGVAAGLRLSALSAEDISSSWIMFNKQNVGDNRDKPQEGGFLMALGLTGHLTKLGKLESFDFLIRGDENITTGYILGMSAAQMGTMDVLATKKISTQLYALLPQTGIELPLSHTTQVASLIGLGLVYIESGHRRMAEVCLNELSRTPGPECENSIDRESYSLAAGLALGMITLGQGDELLGGSLSGTSLAETLYHHMVGGPRPSEIGGRTKFRSPSYQIQEGESINIDVTSPGATLALGLMFLRSGNQRIASWMNAPESQFLLKFVRPDFLMLRTLAKGLILWNDICPTKEWIDSHVPVAILRYCMVRPEDSPLTSNIDYETINQAYCHIISGAALAMAIRFAGSCNSQAFEVLHQMTLSLHAISKRSIAELAGQAIVEQTICILVLSLGIIMAGSGDLEVVRIIRYLGSRVGPKFPTVTYGSHMALHMALGLLFLGGGRFSLSTEPRAVAAMVCAFFPKFPTHSLDNRYHLQALRHLYVLAAEPRLVVPRDIESKELVSCHVEVELADTLWYKGRTLTLKAPVMLPELKYLKRVTIQDPRYHQITFNGGCESWSQLNRILSASGNVHIKQKAGCLSYKDDPQGFRSLIGQCLAKDTAFHWNLSVPQLLSTFASDPGVGYFSKNFVRPINKPNSVSQPFGNVAIHIERTLGSLLYECASHEKLDLLPFWISIFNLLWQWERDGTQHFVGDQMYVMLSLASSVPNRLICPEIVASISQTVKRRLDNVGRSTGRQETLQFLAGKPSPEARQNVVTSQSLCKILTTQGLTSHPVIVEGCETNPLRLMSRSRISGQTAHSFYKLTYQ